MLKKIWNAQINNINIWLVIIIILVLGAGGFASFFYLRQGVYNYTLILPRGENKIETLNYGEWNALQDENFFNKVRNQFIKERVSFIEGDLTAMRLRLYKNGELILEVPILAKGRSGSWWETPVGLYKVRYKTKTLFSSFGKVYQPWSIQFQGNFFIHGWPYYPNGAPVESAYSGGCIRLSNEDAEKIFKEAVIGMPILIYEQNLISGDNFQYEKKVPDKVSSRSLLVADLKNNAVLLKRAPSEIVPIASITKLITAVVAVEYLNIEQMVSIDENMLVKTSRPRLRAGQTISIFNLLHILLQESSNEAAVAISRFLGDQRFNDLANQKVKSLGMLHTEVRDAAGMGAGNISSAEDLFILAKYLFNNKRFVLKLAAGKVYNAAYGETIFGDLKNLNGFSDDPDFIGGKVGKSSEAKETMLAVFEPEIQGQKRPIAIIVLQSEDAKNDVQAILDYIKNSY